jgi:tripartite-type tricarboxylate transporter receptor subunit TctC
MSGPGIAACCAIGVMLGVASHAAPAQNYPVKPVRMICPSVPGGTTDLVARLVAQKLSEDWRQQVIVDNRGGAGGLIGTEMAARSAPDGYTLIIGTMSTHAVNPAFSKHVQYDPVKDFTPVSLVVSAPQLLAAHPSLPVSSARELIALAKAKPGQFSYSSSGIGSTPHIAFELFKLMAQIDVVGIQYKGSGPAITDLVAGQVQMMMTGALALAPHVKAGKLKALAITSPKRSPAMPDLPTVAESGVPGFDVRVWFGVFMPAGAPRYAVVAVNERIRKMLEIPELRQRLIEQGADPASSTPEEFGILVKSDLARWARVVKATGVASADRPAP